MENVSVVFEVLEDGKRPSAAHKRVPFHMIYDIKMDFTSKARFLDQHRQWSTYSKIYS